MQQTTPPSDYILTLHCQDVPGIVAAVSGFLADNGGFINESAQFGDASTHRFFMRCAFELRDRAIDAEQFRTAFSLVASRFDMVWELHQASHKMKLVILVSNEGHCLDDLLHRHRTGALPVEIVGVISNHDTFRDLTQWHGIPFHHLPVTPDTKPQQEQQIRTLIDEAEADLVVLARYMQILSPGLVSALAGKAINIHHSFLPSFKGARPYHQAHTRGVKLIGATAHYVTDELDEGPIIEQEVTRVDHTCYPESLRAMGQDVERLVLARAIRFHSEHRVLPNGNKTVVFR